MYSAMLRTIQIVCSVQICTQCSIANDAMLHMVPFDLYTVPFVHRAIHMQCSAVSSVMLYTLRLIHYSPVHYSAVHAIQLYILQFAHIVLLHTLQLVSKIASYKYQM